MRDYGKHDVLGVLVDAVDMPQAVDRVSEGARLRSSCSVTALAVHGIVEASRDQRMRTALNNFDVVLPDGQPVRWALNMLYGLDLPDKVPGPSFVDELLTRAVDEGYPVHFHGSTVETLARIRAELRGRFGTRLQVTMAPSRFRQIGGDELEELVASINATGAQLCFVGLGCPRQERFVATVAARLEMPAVGVGAAFDYLAGNISRAPRALQRAGLEWLYRTVQEPRRLARRYITTNSAFMVGITAQWARLRLQRGGAEATPQDYRPQVWSLVDA